MDCTCCNCTLRCTVPGCWRWAGAWCTARARSTPLRTRPWWRPCCSSVAPRCSCAMSVTGSPSSSACQASTPGKCVTRPGGLTAGRRLRRWDTTLSPPCSQGSTPKPSPWSGACASCHTTRTRVAFSWQCCRKWASCPGTSGRQTPSSPQAARRNAGTQRPPSQTRWPQHAKLQPMRSRPQRQRWQVWLLGMRRQSTRLPSRQAWQPQWPTGLLRR
mmetsp:Transcript_7693/g.13294  ORF Transcript_7693/g.13294 Transcript_7693/m.13294 type:complete len:216 (-) Transcript_7693:1529-2176(-)